MYAWIQHLAVQQTTAPELATFLVLVTAACVIAAILAYTIIMSVAWATRLRARKWWDVVIPNPTALRENWLGYVLAIVTSVILALTLAAKDDLVDRVLATDARPYVDSPMFARLFPLGRVPTAADIGVGKSLSEAVRTVAGSDLSDLVRAPLAAGRAEGVRSILLAAARETIRKQGPAMSMRIAQLLKFACFAMMFVYILWIALPRIRVLSAPDSGAPRLQEGVGQRLVALGVCLALLLANPLSDPTPELLADSALAAARVAPVRTPLLDSLAALGTAGQTNVLIAGTMSRDSVARQRIDELSRRVVGYSEQFRVELSGKASIADLSSKASVAALSGKASIADVADARARLGEIARALDSLGKRSLLLVVAGTGRSFAVQGGSIRARGVGAGLYSVVPGQYVVTAAPSVSQSASVRAGEHVVVLLQARGANVVGALPDSIGKATGIVAAKSTLSKATLSKAMLSKATVPPKPIQ